MPILLKKITILYELIYEDLDQKLQKTSSITKTELMMKLAAILERYYELLTITIWSLVTLIRQLIKVRPDLMLRPINCGK